MTNTQVVVIGAGFSGLAAAYDLAKAGREVTIVEADSDIGGLAGTFTPQPGVRLEKFYHHWFTSDEAIIELITELGLASRLKPVLSNTGLYFANSIFRLTSPLDLLRFPAIPILDRARTGLMALYARAISDWSALESISAIDWLIKVGGKPAYKAIWQPLLAGKFGIEAENVSAVWFWNKLKLRGSSRGRSGGETLLYFEGGFGALSDAVRENLIGMGVNIHTNTPATRVVTSNGAVSAVCATDPSGTELLLPAHQVLVTTPLPTLFDLAPDLSESDIAPWRQIRFLGNVCLVLRLKHSLSSTYWLNVADPTFPFIGVIEHTNLDDRANYGGEHIAYLSKYLPTSEKLFSMPDKELLDYALPHIQRMFPHFSEEWIIAAHIWRAKFSQPVIVKNYSKLIPPFALPINDLWLCTMAQVYPQDRGTNYAVEYGRRVAEMMLE